MHILPLLIVAGMAVCSSVYVRASESDRKPVDTEAVVFKQDVSAYADAVRIIDSFKNNATFLYKDDVDFVIKNGDSILRIFNHTKNYDCYFEFGRILIYSYLRVGEMRMAIVVGERMYSRAQAAKYNFGKALSLNAIGKIHANNYRERDVVLAYEEALRLYALCTDHNNIYLILALLEISEYYLDNGNPQQAGRYIYRLNKYVPDMAGTSAGYLSDILNFYYLLQTGHVEEAERFMQQLDKLSGSFSPHLLYYYNVSKALYYELKGDSDEALKLYDVCLASEYTKMNISLSKSIMQRKAALLQKIEQKEEAYALYWKVYNQAETMFVKNYSKEIDHLSARFQADNLTYQNEVDRNFFIRYYTAGIVLCIVVLVILIYLSTNKIKKLKRSVREKDIIIRTGENAIRKKNLYLSNMSHEIRTPLNAIVGFSNLLVSDENTLDLEQQSEYYEIIKINSFQLQKLIDDIVHLSDFEDEDFELTIGKYDVAKICNEVLETVIASYYPTVSVTFETDMKGVVIETDDARFRQVLINLLVNAIKFTKEGSIVLKLEKNDDNGVLLSVTDTGCGIPPEKRKVIFERFEKLNDHAQGSGLGLSICSLILKQLNGEFWIDESYTQGARFCFTHPFKYEQKQQS